MPTTWPERIEDTPAHDWYPGENGHVTYGEGLLVGHRWYLDQGIQPQWWFGHGLSYTTFDWKLADVGPVSPAPLRADALDIEAVVQVVNTGDRPGTAVAQIYLASLDRPVDGPPQVLAGFARLAAGPGESDEVAIALLPTAFRRWDTDTHAWVVDPGRYEVRLGRSAGDIVATHTITVEPPA
jgi:beta-glucosidase